MVFSLRERKRAKCMTRLSWKKTWKTENHMDTNRREQKTGWWMENMEWGAKCSQRQGSVETECVQCRSHVLHKEEDREQVTGKTYQLGSWVRLGIIIIIVGGRGERKIDSHSWLPANIFSRNWGIEHISPRYRVMCQSNRDIGIPRGAEFEFVSWWHRSKKFDDIWDG